MARHSCVTRPSHQAAAHYTLLAAERGVTSAMAAAARAFHHGVGVPASAAQARLVLGLPALPAHALCHALPPNGRCGRLTFVASSRPHAQQAVQWYHGAINARAAFEFGRDEDEEEGQRLPGGDATEARSPACQNSSAHAPEVRADTAASPCVLFLFPLLRRRSC